MVYCKFIPAPGDANSGDCPVSPMKLKKLKHEDTWRNAVVLSNLELSSHGAAPVEGLGMVPSYARCIPRMRDLAM